MKTRSNDYYFKLFNEELSIAQALVDSIQTKQCIFDCNNYEHHFALCAACVNLLDTSSPQLYSQRYRAKERLDSLMRIYEQKKLLWLTIAEQDPIEYENLYF